MKWFKDKEFKITLLKIKFGGERLNILDQIKLLFRVRKPVGNLIKGVSTVKSGWKTSEFWLVIISNLITIVGSLQGVIDAETATIALAILNGVYTIMRNILKGGQAVIAPGSEFTQETKIVTESAPPAKPGK